MQQFDIRVTVHEILGEEYDEFTEEGETVTADDFHLTDSELMELSEAIEHTLAASTFFVAGEGKFVDSRRFSLTISHIRPHF